MKDNLVVWNQEMLIPLELPASKDALSFKLYDYDTTGDDLVGSLNFSIKQMIKDVAM